jgi:FKBP-type peptidyl-prolyl cis-trans isomerase FkpA
MIRYHRVLLITAAAALLSISGCSMDVFRRQGPKQVSGEPETLKYADELKVELDQMTRTASGLYYLDRVVGTGATAEFDKPVSVGYVGALADGRVFDRSGLGSPYEFMLGQGEVIRGWDEGIAGMKVGGRRLLVIRPSLAYGNASPGAGIPANATLVFDVMLEGVGE